jgi:hypothetical protein
MTRPITVAMTVGQNHMLTCIQVHHRLVDASRYSYANTRKKTNATATETAIMPLVIARDLLSVNANVMLTPGSVMSP